MEMEFGYEKVCYFQKSLLFITAMMISTSFPLNLLARESKTVRDRAQSPSLLELILTRTERLVILSSFFISDLDCSPCFEEGSRPTLQQLAEGRVTP